MKTSEDDEVQEDQISDKFTKSHSYNSQCHFVSAKTYFANLQAVKHSPRKQGISINNGKCTLQGHVYLDVDL